MSKEEEKKFDFNRRDFLGVTIAAAALAACSRSEPAAVLGTKMTPGPKIAPDGPVLKAGLVGCGGRGTGAAINFLDAGPNLEVAALADLFEDRLERCRKGLKEKKGVEVPDSRCFLGFDAYQKLIDSGVDIVLLATPPHFRPEHFQAAVEARKHVFMEKPVAVDPVGVRSIIATSEKADAFGLTVATGTQRRHEHSYIETYNRIVDGAIGEILAARDYSLRSQLWYREPQKEWSRMEAMLRDWVNWQWLSGDFIVEQVIHGLDTIHWFTNSHPLKAVGVGGRARRVTGDQYDFFSIDYELENGVHLQSVSRQVNGCTNNISDWVIGTKGYTDCEQAIFDLKGNVIWQYDPEQKKQDTSPYVQEHIDMVTSIRTGSPFNEAVNTADSTLTAIMGRDSAYSGVEVSWDELMQSPRRLGPTDYAMGPVTIDGALPVPGTA